MQKQVTGSALCAAKLKLKHGLMLRNLIMIILIIHYGHYSIKPSAWAWASLWHWPGQWQRQVAQVLYLPPLARKAAIDLSSSHVAHGAARERADMSLVVVRATSPAAWGLPWSAFCSSILLWMEPSTTAVAQDTRLSKMAISFWYLFLRALAEFLQNGVGIVKDSVHDPLQARNGLTPGTFCSRDFRLVHPCLLSRLWLLRISWLWSSFSESWQQRGQ